MWLKSILPFLLLVGTVLSDSDSEPKKSIFTAVSPKLIRENSKYIVRISVEDSAPSAISFTVSINNTDVEAPVQFSSAPLEVQAGKSENIEVEVKELPHHAYNLTITGKYGDEEFQDSASVFKDTKTQSLLLQTDKVIYKPGETVKFRVVMLCRRLRPLDNQLVNITIVDPMRNIIKVLNNEEVSKGIFSSAIELSTEPNLGDWKIRAEANGQTESHSFSVDQYVLPKFKVEVLLPPFVTYNSSKLTAIRTAYT
jgi:uncharacterized protein YfaS (alpha-2-macroglobulin family)